MADSPSIYPDLARHFTPTETGSTVCSYSKKIPGDGPTVILIHGYPQSAYIWRYIVPMLSQHVSVFVPELPSYGVSTPCNKPLTKRLMGEAILQALKTVFSPPPGHKIIFLAHDRGARVSHRMAVDYAHPSPDSPAVLKHFTLESIILLDILPTTAQWQAFQSPVVSNAYFHWPFLARLDVAVPMLTAWGGDKLCQLLLERGSGKPEASRARFFAGDSASIYTRNFATADAVKGSCEDYADGATVELKLQEEDQKAGRKITVPTMLMWSQGGVGSWAVLDVEWRKWAAEGTRVEGTGIGEGCGHYLPEERPDVVGPKVIEWLKSLGVNLE